MTFDLTDVHVTYQATPSWRRRSSTSEPLEALRGVTLGLAPGRTVAVVGPNGAGKTTLLNCLAGTAWPDRGSVTLAGRSVARMAPGERARHVAVVPQSATFPEGYDVATLVAMGRNPYVGPFGRWTRADDAIVADAMERTGTTALRARRADQLSGGERQRVVLARALAQDPAWCLFDEPTNHLDLKRQVEVLSQVAALAADGRGVVWVVHDLNLAARCDRVLVMTGGRIVADGTPDTVLTSDLLTAVFGTAVLVRPGERPGAAPTVTLDDGCS